MPTYEYECRSCNEVFDVFQSMRDAPLTECPKCGKPEVRRLIGRGAGIIFKGSGFYETDYRRPPQKKESGESSGGGEAAKSESPKPEPAKPAAAGSSSSSGATKQAD